VSTLGTGPVHQAVVIAAPNDAITGSVMALRDLLRESRWSEVFALHVHPDLLGDVHLHTEYSSIAAHGSDAVTIVHLSMGDDGFLPFLAEIPGRFIISYHNVTPASYFAPWDPPTARLLELGRRYLTDLRERAAVAIADSDYNASELRRAGYRDVRVGGLALEVERLSTLPAASFFDPHRGPLILSVGQLYPHKRPDILLAAFHRLVNELRPDARLVIAGAARLQSFAQAVDSYVDRLGLSSRVTITREIPDLELAAWFRAADLFVTMSEHEGFCVPLVEAMFFDVPVLGRACGAVPETVGGAGVIVPEAAGPSSIARVMAAMLEDPGATACLRDRGRIRREDFTRDSCRRRLREALDL
jgi:L-malate glycosyltransferase